MPRVTRHTARQSTKDRRCRGCGGPIEPGNEYYLWEKRYGGPQFRHVPCGYPRPTELSNRKTAQIEEAIQDADFSSCDTEEDCQALLENIAQTARDVGEEYRDSFNNMPEGLQQGGTAQAMEQVAEELDSWADDLEGWSWDGQDDDIEAMQDAAREMLDNMPEYQG